MSRVPCVSSDLAFFMLGDVNKFTTGHLFQYIQYQSGIDLFDPFVNNLTGIAEIAAGLAILYRPTHHRTTADRSVDGVVDRAGGRRVGLDDGVVGRSRSDPCRM